MMQRRLILSMAALYGAIASWDARAEASPGQMAPNFEVVDALGKKRTLREFRDKLVVLEWSSPSCPFARAQYQSGRMQELQKWAMQHGVVWLTVLSSHPTRTDYLPGAKASAMNEARGGQPTALLIDAEGKLGRAYGAAVANHMFVIDKKGSVAYAGGIDDAQSFDLAKVSQAKNHVRDALDDLLSAKKPRVPSTEPYGCSLAYAGH